MSQPRITFDSIAVIGLGYVGLPLALGLARQGAKVIGFDSSRSVVSNLLAGLSHVDDISSTEIEEYLQSGGSFSWDPDHLGSAEAYVICVPTPLGQDGFPDLSAVESAAAVIGRSIREGSLVVLESTTYPGTTEEVVLPILGQESGLVAGHDYFLAYSPERIDPGNTEFTVTNTPKVVGGLTPESLDRAARLYELLGVPIVRARGLKEAEMSKLLENTYRHVNIALVNEMARFCRALDIDIRDAIRCAATKPFGFAAFSPGPGVGGHCIPIDPNYLSHRVRSKLGYPFRFVELAQEINAGMPTYVVSRAQELLNDQSCSLRGAEVLVLGMTYKADVADPRESPSIPVVSLLLAAGSKVSVCDPYLPADTYAGLAVDVVRVEDLPPASQSKPYSLAILMQTHGAFDDLDFEGIANSVLDTRGVLTGPDVSGL